MKRGAFSTVRVGPVTFSNGGPLVFVAGLCALESERVLRRVGNFLQKALARQRIPFVLKCSFDKANRSSLRSYRGRGLERGLEILGRVKSDLGVPLLTDVHESGQAALAARVADILQVPAFLARQTDLLIACGRTGKPVNIKKAQFMAPWEMRHSVDKVLSTGNRRILVTERGTLFGYGNLVVDMRSLEMLKGLGVPVLFDCTHSVQLPGGLKNGTGGERQYAFPLARAAAAVGVAGIYLETHPDPDRALSDGPNSLRLKDLPPIFRRLKEIDVLIKQP